MACSLLEREHELAQLEALFDNPGGVAIIEGPAGIGKTALLSAASDAAAARGLTVLRARGHDLDREIPLGVVRQLLEPGVAATDALMIAVDDADWADEPSLRWLHDLARRTPVLPVCMVLAVRRAAAGLLARIATESTVLRLRPLSSAAASELIPGEAAYTATGGNPFLLCATPEAVTLRVLVRLARLPGGAQAFARAAAVLGDGAEPRHAATLAELDEANAAAAFDALAAADFLRPSRPLGFVQPLLRDVLYAELAPGERTLAHARAARALHDAGAHPERIALHLLHCEPAGSGWAVDVLRAAARDAPARRAVTYLERACEEPPPREQRSAVLRELGRAELSAGSPRAATHLEQAGERGVDLAVASGRPTDLEGTGAHAVVLANTCLEARRRMRALPLLTGLQSAALAKELAHRGGTADQVAALAARSLAAADAVSSLPDAILVAAAADALTLCDRPARAVTAIERLLRGAPAVSALALTQRARLSNAIGRPPEAEADARLVLLRQDARAELATALIERGDLPAAARMLTGAEIAGHDTMSALRLRDAYARLLLLQGDHDHALEQTEILERADRAWDIRNPGWTAWRITAALAHRHRGDHDRARRLAADELAAAQAFGAPRQLGVALRTIGLLEGSVETLRESVAVLERSPARLEHARSAVALGAALRRAGHHREARHPLRAGEALALDCGAAAVADHAREELLSSGARPCRRGAGRDALTPSERRIAALAADGLSNRDIAQTLYLSLKTVEMHLTRAYRKLGISSRRELAATITAGG